MYTLIFCCCFLGFFALYNTSQRAKLSKAGAVEKWLQAHPKESKTIGASLLLASLLLFVLNAGTAVGAFSGVLLLMAFSALIISFAPFYYLKKLHMVSLFLLSASLELFIF